MGWVRRRKMRLFETHKLETLLIATRARAQEELGKAAKETSEYYDFFLSAASCLEERAKDIITVLAERQTCPNPTET